MWTLKWVAQARSISPAFVTVHQLWPHDPHSVFPSLTFWECVFKDNSRYKQRARLAPASFSSGTRSWDICADCQHRDVFRCRWTVVVSTVARWLHGYYLRAHYCYCGVLPRAIKTMGQRKHRKMHRFKIKPLAAANTSIQFSLSPPFSLKEKLKKMKAFNQQAVKMLGRGLGVSPQFNSGPTYQGSTLNTV